MAATLFCNSYNKAMLELFKYTDYRAISFTNYYKEVA